MGYYWWTIHTNSKSTLQYFWSCSLHDKWTSAYLPLMSLIISMETLGGLNSVPSTPNLISWQDLYSNPNSWYFHRSRHPFDVISSPKHTIDSHHQRTNKTAFEGRMHPNPMIWCGSRQAPDNLSKPRRLIFPNHVLLGFGMCRYPLIWRNRPDHCPRTVYRCELRRSPMERT